MSNNNNWKTQLDRILLEYNGKHALRNKVVSHSTMEARKLGLERAFNTLRALGYKPTPANLSGKHIRALMNHWTARSGTQSGQTAASTVRRPFSAAYIQQQLSFLRVFGLWIGKPGLVLGAEHYTDDLTLVTRHYSAQRDKSWTGNGVEIERVIDAVAAIDERVGAQLRLLLAFGLRRKEAVMFCPHASEVPAYALPVGYPASGIDHYVSFLRIKRGTKGGRLRFAAVRNDAQRRALTEAYRLARFKHSHVGHPDLTLKQSLDLFSNVVRKVGLTKTQLGVTPHGLRHEFAGDLFFDIANCQAPVRAGHACLDAEAMRIIYHQVALQMGHNRPQISNAYLGSAVQHKPRQEADCDAAH
ncbi:integrase domain-containing protein [Janthinobacterium sp. NKUCC06_STL]|uniref:integrase domain-containing protein n=1 Tax=Janthinobacterium sp. NKUCC06_STL TaxID=2842127 RepID=UPI001C5AE84A|nr:integrase domain-containing protein [Janthinobacterium sp. NKUCC06_STL]MBW3512066.1 integrase domain-containing protein [Janthinobacterium sp. NKUCC06_STL]